MMKFPQFSSKKAKVIGLLLIAVVAFAVVFAVNTSTIGDLVFIAKYRSYSGFWDSYPSFKENRDFIKKNPNNDSAYYSLGQGLYTLKAYDGSIDAFIHATAIAPNTDYYWAFLGKVYQAKKDYTKARDAYVKVLELNPGKTSSYTTLAWLYYFRLPGEEFKAYEVLKKGLEKFPTDKDILFDITRYYLYDRNTEEFRIYAKRYLKIDPDNELIKNAYEKGIPKSS